MSGDKIVFGGVAIDQNGLKVYHSDFLEINPIIQALVASIDFSVPQKRSFGAHPRTKGHTIQYMVENNIAFVSSATSNFPHRICFKFLEALATEFKTADLNAAKGTQLFEQFIRNQIKYYSEDSSADPLRALNKQVGEVQAVMHNSVEIALARGDNLEKMMSKAENLEEKSIYFRKKAKAVYCAMLRENMQTTVILVAIILGILAFIGGVIALFLYFNMGAASTTTN